ncbi:hypothetical protein N9C01_00160 [bacterium]|nr:hypothetical protein [bacterium]
MNLVVDAASYPFRESGKYMLIWGAVLSVIASLAGLAPILGFFAVLFISAYFCATYFSIVETTAVGQAIAPQFPDVSNTLEDLLVPFLKVLAVFVISFLPYIAYLLATGVDDAIADLLLILGIVYFPMAILAVIVLGYLGAMSPMIVIPGIFRAGGSYIVAVLFLALIYFLEAFVAEIFENSLFIGPIIMGLLGMYVLMASARTLGKVYQNRSEELNWL